MDLTSDKKDVMHYNKRASSWPYLPLWTGSSLHGWYLLNYPFWGSGAMEIYLCNLAVVKATQASASELINLSAWATGCFELYILLLCCWNLSTKTFS